MKIAATADLHARTGDIERLRALAEGATLEADVLVMGGTSQIWDKASKPKCSSKLWALVLFPSSPL